MNRLTLLAAAALAVGVAAPAVAADLPARAPAPYTKAPAIVQAAYDWSGFYVGINGGWGTSDINWNADPFPGFPSGDEGSHHASGGTIGGQVGYRWQMSSWVFGVEAQGNWADFNGTAASLAFPLVTNQMKVDAFGLFTGQVGYAWNNALFYLKGGAALTDNKYAGIVTATQLQLGTANDTRWGGTVGVGIEYGFAPNWSAAVEYDHLFMSTQNIGFTGVAPFNLGVGTRQDSIDQNIDMVTARVNYRFGGPVVARY